MSQPDSVTFADIEVAAKRLAGIAHHTPFWIMQSLHSELIRYITVLQV
ncbi:MAG: hypothetical protein HXY43_18210 [Fischerella sp.]|jgi:hypothetical protein|nr:hypothetical protein [Fischerella sp.]NWF61131.1 hypothetical protein [Fischerella sp.]